MKDNKNSFFASKDDSFFSGFSSDDCFALSPDMLEKVAGGRYTTDPNDPDFETMMWEYDEKEWKKWFE